jgi:hypothetical protein
VDSRSRRCSVVTALNDVPALLMKPRYRGVGGMARLDRDRKLAKAEMHRNFSVLARQLSFVLAAGGGRRAVSR